MKQRKEHVVNIIDRIAEGKKRKLLGLSTNKKKNTKNQLPEERKSLNSEASPIIDKDALLQEEFSKIQPVTMVNTLLQIFTGKHIPLSEFLRCFFHICLTYTFLHSERTLM